MPERASVLIVDDNATNRDLLVRMLARPGLVTAVAEDGEQALAMIGSQRFDLILLDVVMPRMNGHEVLERLKASDTLRHVPVIVISSLDDLDSITACIQMGAEDYLPRPFNSTILRARIASVPWRPTDDAYPMLAGHVSGRRAA